MEESKTRLGKTDVLVTPLGTGAWEWGDRSLWGYGKDYGEVEVRAAFHASLDAGIDFFDTAEIYGFGLSERLLGRFVRDAGRPVTIATKFTPLPWRWRRQDVVAVLRQNLARLGMDHVDLYQIHFPLPPFATGIWLDGLADAVELGLTRAVGVSNYNAAQTRRAHAALAHRGIPLASNQVEYSLLDRRPDKGQLADTCHELGITIIAYSPLRKGVLTGKYTPSNLPPGRRRASYNRQYMERVQPLIDLMRQVGAAHGGKSPAQVALNWLVCKGAVAIPGAKNAQQVQDNAGALGWRLSESEIAELDIVSSTVSTRRPA